MENRIKEETAISLSLLSHQCHISPGNKRDPSGSSLEPAPRLPVLTDDNKEQSKLAILSEAGG